MDKIYGVWVHSIDPSYAWLNDDMPPDLEDLDVALQTGKPVGKNFPEDIVFDLSPTRGMQLTDSLPNTILLYVVSERLKDIITKTGVPVEFHGVKIRNLKKRIAREPYYVMNLLGTLDCMDREKSDWRESELVAGRASLIRRLDLTLSKIPDDRPIFRLASEPRLVLARVDLAREILRDTECRGMIFKKLELYGEEFRRPVPSYNKG